MYFIGLSTMSRDLNQENLASALQLVYEDRKRKNTATIVLSSSCSILDTLVMV